MTADSADSREALVEVVAEHGDAAIINSREQWVGCLCGAKLPVGHFDDPDMGWSNPEVEERVRAEHLADAILTAGWRKTDIEVTDVMVEADRTVFRH